MPVVKEQRTWRECDFPWGNPPDPFVWSDVWILIDVTSVIFAEGEKGLKKWQDREKKKKQKLIKLICIINNERIEKSKYANNADIEISDIELLVERALNKRVSISFNSGDE